MGTIRRKRVAYDVERIEADMARRGWQDLDLARRAGVSKMTVSRFLRRDVQTVKTGKKLSEALGRSPSYYLIVPAAAASSR